MVSDDEKKTTEDSRFRELSPGKLLVWGRERAGLTQEQVAKELYMTLTKVRALESDDYRHMGSDTFTRGYLRSYANLVKVDVVQVLVAYDRHAQKNGLVEQVLPRKVESTTKPLWQFAAIIVGVLMVLWLISVWFFDNRKEPAYDIPATIVAPVESYTNTSLPPVSSVMSSAVAEDNLAVEATVGIGSSLNSSVSSAASFSSMPTSKSVSSLGGNNFSAASSAKISTRTSGALDQIAFVFSEECWLEVSDSRGDVLVADLQVAGAHLTLQGKAPFDVKLGNASAVKIELNDEKVTVVPALGTNVLSLKVGKSINE